MPSGKLHAQEKYADRMHRLGHVKVAAWVPEQHRDTMLDFAFDLRIAHESKLPLTKQDNLL